MDLDLDLDSVALALDSVALDLDSVDLDSVDLDSVDLDVELDDYLLHPHPAACLRITHAFMRATRSIEHVCEETVAIENGVLRQEQLIWCIKRQQLQQRAQCQTHFKLRAMFLYNMDLEAEEIQDFAAQTTTTTQPLQRFMIPISAVEDVVVRPTIPMFAQLNGLYILYEAGQDQSQSQSQSKKRVVIHSGKHKDKHKHKHTRRT